ncbi:ABC transporter ATP-binding protein [Aquibacillus albus]|uniref:ATP-binding cassette subfamily B protein/subfamily B ATP-binding cassette protein MsbA n=1 Tax=Aquibacillus albus TaxID=1168171 RepID=A0ABS2N6D5_9BACI|nr:ABC transporter ATP-binding protein [Aquibacillus albus]MBM7573661.1 ATP-binding cassette subfamily B protein/subfamily B ATP-binding cassette protein MsbA [Aquibacillus albus]
MKDFLKIKSFFLPYKRYFILSMLFLVAMTGMGVLAPLLLKYLVDDVILKEQYELVPYVALAVIVVAILKGAFQFLSSYMGHQLGINTVYDLRNSLYQKLQYLSLGYYSRAKTGDLMARLTGDVEKIRNFLSGGMVKLTRIFLTFIAGLSVMAFYSVKLTAVTFIVLGLLIAVAYRFQKVVRPSFRTIRKSVADLNTGIQENIMGIRTVKSFGHEAFEESKFYHRNDEFKQAHLDSSRIWSRYFPVMEMLGGSCIVILLGYGGFLVLNEELSLGALVAFFSLIWLIVNPLTDLGFTINNFMQSVTSAERLNELLETPEDILSPQEPVYQQNNKTEINFKDVSFGYQTRKDTLSDINLDVSPGKTIGVLGATGSGKSSIIQLLFRAYDTTEGAVHVNGNDTRQLHLSKLRREFGIVMQEPFIFSASILDNIRYGDPYASMEKIIDSAKLADAHEFISELPQGYDTIVGERGLGLSGGQKQRIAIARALLVNPEVLVLDDATSALDMETEYHILSNLKSMMTNQSTFIIAHRISSLKNADEIIVLDKGKIVERGTHQELLQQNGIYRKTYDVQHASQTENLRRRSRAL